MTLQEIRQFPTCYTCYTDSIGRKCHESLLRAHHVAYKLMSLIDVGTPKEVVREIFEDLTATTGDPRTASQPTP